MTTQTEPKTFTQIGKIESTYLGYEDHGMFSVNVDFDFGGGHHQGTGHIALGRAENSVAGDLIEAILHAAGVSRWEALKGRTVYVVRDEARIVGIAPLPTEPGEGFTFALEDGEFVIRPYEAPR